MKIVKAKKIYTVDADFTTGTGLVMNEGKVVEVGDFDELLTKYEGEVDYSYSEQYIYPGFVEPHCHGIFSSIVFGAGPLIDFKKWDFGKYGHYPACLSHDEMMKRLKESFAEGGRENYIFYGYNKQYHGEITRKELDEMMPDAPVVLLHSTGHGAIFNTVGMKKFGFDQRDKNTYGCGLNEDGDYNGVFTEAAYMPFMGSFYQQVNTPEVLEEGRKKFLENAKIHGVIAVSEYMGGASAGLYPELDFYTKLATNEYPVHVSFLINFQNSLIRNENDADKTFEEIQSLLKKYDHENFKFMKALKFFFDGAVIDHQIKLSEPLTNGYSDDWNYKFLNHDIDTFVNDVKRYWENGYDFYVHSQGDESQITFAKKIKELLELYPREDYIASIQHFAFEDDEFFQFVKESDLHLQISALPRYMDVWNKWKEAGLYPDKFLTKEFLRLKDVLDDSEHFHLSFHSDAMNNPTTPLYEVYKAVTRRDINDHLINDDPSQCIDVQSGLKAITIEAAKQNRNEDQFGSLEPNKRASFVVFDNDFMNGDADLLKQPVKHLVMDGKEVPFS
ncbi:amidohydrolase [Bacillus sp. 1P06AnD]|uniref:amidohydrolase n=1 Tax=Bacillus sp. 1P06AnD TaxID=3132208 RepID=UPI00399FA149